MHNDNERKTVKIEKTSLAAAMRREDADIATTEKYIRSGEAVVLKNRCRDMEKPCVVGRGLATKVNANVGLSPDRSDIDNEVKKMEAAVAAGADAVMDLSMGPFLGELRRKILALCPVPVGTVPVYELTGEKRGAFESLKEEDFISVLRQQAAEGVDFFTVHSGITLEIVRGMDSARGRDRRILDIVSRGGALLASWMMANNRENPFFSRFDEVMDIAKEYDIVLSLGDSLRPGTIMDATDRFQIQELLVLGELQQRAFNRGVQTIIEGPGHVPLDQIEANVRLQKKICHGAPFYVLGPLVTDAAPGYDHIVGAIGGAIAAWHGADFLCYVTPAEHLRLPDIDDVHRGVMASKIAAHAADIVKGIPSARKRDEDISKARAKRDWKKQFALSLDPELPRKVRESSQPKESDVCTMCSEFCSIKIAEECFKTKRGTAQSA